MGLYKRGKVYWYSTVASGRLIRKSTKQTNKKKAEQFYASILQSVQTGNYVPEERRELWPRHESLTRVPLEGLQPFGRRRDPRRARAPEAWKRGAPEPRKRRYSSSRRTLSYTSRRWPTATTITSMRASMMR